MERSPDPQRDAFFRKQTSRSYSSSKTARTHKQLRRKLFRAAADICLFLEAVSPLTCSPFEPVRTKLVFIIGSICAGRIFVQCSEAFCHLLYTPTEPYFQALCWSNLHRFLTQIMQNNFIPSAIQYFRTIQKSPYIPCCDPLSDSSHHVLYLKDTAGSTDS